MFCTLSSGTIDFALLAGLTLGVKYIDGLLAGYVVRAFATKQQKFSPFPTSVISPSVWQLLASCFEINSLVLLETTVPKV